jgi:arylsulfatase A-like enzyme
MKKIYISSIISSLTIVILIILFLQQCSGERIKSYDFINNFKEAEAEGLSRNSFIESGFQISDRTWANSPLMKAVSLAFSNPDSILRHHDKKSSTLGNAANAGIWLNLLPTEKVEDTYRFEIGESRKGKKYLVEIAASYDGEIRLILKDQSGDPHVLASAYTRLRKNLEYRLVILSLNNRIIVIHKKRILINTTILEDLTTRDFRFLLEGLSDFAKYILKFSRFSAETTNRIENALQFQRWGGASFKPIYPGDSTYPNNLAHVFLEDISRRAIVMPLNSRIEFSLDCPEKAVLELEVSLLKNTGNIINNAYFLLSIASSNQEKSISKRYPLSDLCQWNSERIDLRMFGGSEINIKFITESADEKLIDDCLLLLANPVIRTKREADEKNILLICLDTLRPDHLGAYGYKRDTSPNIDLFAADGVIFKQAIANSSWTLPSHASMFSSLYPLETGCVLGENFRQITYSRLNDQIKTLAEYLKDSGYKTHAITGNGWVSPQFGFDQGFECYRNVKEKSAAMYVMGQPSITGGDDKSDYKDFKYSADECIKWIENNSDYKWFIFLHTYEIHAPYTRRHFSPDPSDGKAAQTIANYDSGILYADIQVGRIIKKLKDMGISENTVVIVTSDHGESFYKKNGEPEGEDYGRHGHNLYDEQIRVPLIISGISKADSEVEEQVRLIDIMPTLLDVCGIDPPNNVRGTSFLPLVNREADYKRVAYSEAIRGKRDFDMKSLRFNGFKLISNEDYAKRLKRYELYDLLDDLKETIDLSEKALDRLNRFERIINEIKAGIDQNRKNLHRNRRISIDRDIQKQLETLGYLGKSKTPQ